MIWPALILGLNHAENGKNHQDEIELPKVERPKKEEIIAYFINDSIATKSQMDSLDPNTIDKMDVIKEGAILDSLNQTSSVNYNGIIKITLNNQQ